MNDYSLYTTLGDLTPINDENLQSKLSDWLDQNTITRFGFTIARAIIEIDHNFIKIRNFIFDMLYFIASVKPILFINKSLSIKCLATFILHLLSLI